MSPTRSIPGFVGGRGIPAAKRAGEPVEAAGVAGGTFHRGARGGEGIGQNYDDREPDDQRHGIVGGC